MLARAELKKAVFHQIFRPGHADAGAEIADGLGGVAPAAQAAEGGHPGIVPAAHITALDELDQLAFREHGIGEAEARELDLLRMIHAQGVQHPIVQLAVVDEFERADGMGDPFHRVGQAVREIVHRVDAPFVARAVVLGVADAVERGIAHDHVGGGHVDPGAQDVLAVRELAVTHPMEKIKVFFHGTVAVGAFHARLRQGAPAGPDFLGGLAVHIGLAVADELLGVGIQAVEVVGGVEFAVVPVAAEPMHVFADGIDVFGIFLHRIGIVKAQVAQAAVLAGQAEVDADRLGVADVQVAVGLRGKAGMHLGPETPGGVVLIDAHVQKIEPGGVFRPVGKRFRGGSIHEKSFAAAFRGRLAFAKPCGSGLGGLQPSKNHPLQAPFSRGTCKEKRRSASAPHRSPALRKKRLFAGGCHKEGV